MNHKPRTRLAAMLLACLLLCPSPGRSEAAVQTDVRCRKKRRYRQKKRRSPRKPCRSRQQRRQRKRRKKWSLRKHLHFLHRNLCRSQPRLHQKQRFQRSLLHKPRPKHRSLQPRNRLPYPKQKRHRPRLKQCRHKQGNPCRSPCKTPWPSAVTPMCWLRLSLCMPRRTSPNQPIA